MNTPRRSMLAHVVALMIISAAGLSAQSPDGVRFGLTVDLALNIHSAEFEELPGNPTCCEQYTGGAGLGLVVGPSVELPVGGDGAVLLRPAWFLRSGSLSEEERTTVIIDGRPAEAVIEHVLDARLSTLGGEVLGATPLVGALRLVGGFRLGAVVASSYESREVLSKPEDVGTFENGRRVRNEFSGEIPGAERVDVGVVLGLDLRIPLGRNGTTTLVPELLFSRDLTRVTDVVPWRTSALRLGATLSYGAARAEPVVVLPSEPSRESDLPATLGAALSAVSVAADGTERRDVVVHVEEFISTNMRPLLNYVFFDEGSADVPDRYVRRAPGDATFTDRTLHGLDPIATYHEVLNIVGYRMTLYPEAPLVLTGTTAGAGAESGDLALARARALAVRDYIARTWRIDTTRITVDVRPAPEHPSDTATVDGRAENRRVEIRSSDLRVTEPVITRDTLRQITPPLVRLRPSASGSAVVERWQVDVEQGAARVARFAGEGPPPPTIDWETNRDQQLAPRSDVPLALRLTLESAATSAVGRTELPVELVTIRRKREERIGDRVIDRFRLILFGFDRADLDDANQRLARFIGERIRPGATVTVTGHTDRTGDELHNLQLSQSRARATADAIGAPNATVTGLGESPLLYDNTMPEGRFYSRTVQVRVDTVVENGEE